MIDVKSIIKTRLDEIEKEFNELKEQVVQAEQFVAKGKVQMAVLQGTFKENTGILEALEQESEGAEVKEDVCGNGLALSSPPKIKK